MIEKSFKLFEILDKETVKSLPDKGIHTWYDFLKEESIPGISDTLKKQVDIRIDEHLAALKKRDYKHFRNLRPSVHWLLYNRIKEERRVCYLDIETTGLQFFKDEVTMVGVSDGTHYQTMVKDINLNEKNLKKILADCDMLVTHYGFKFDIPFLKYLFPDLDLGMLHFDVSFSARKLEMGEDLKEIEKTLGIERDKHIAEISGCKAVKLWEKYLEGDRDSLDLLIDCNRQDVINLPLIATKIYERLCEKYFCAAGKGCKDDSHI